MGAHLDPRAGPRRGLRRDRNDERQQLWPCGKGTANSYLPPFAAKLILPRTPSRWYGPALVGPVRVFFFFFPFLFFSFFLFFFCSSLFVFFSVSFLFFHFSFSFLFSFLFCFLGSFIFLFWFLFIFVSFFFFIIFSFFILIFKIVHDFENTHFLKCSD